MRDLPPHSFLGDLLTAVDAADPPNILILLGDDIDKTSLGPWGGQAHTPHIDQLARDGVRLDCCLRQCCDVRTISTGIFQWPMCLAYRSYAKSFKI